MKKHSFLIVLTVFAQIFINCSNKTSSEIFVEEKGAELLGYNLRPVNIQNVKITDTFWLPIIKKVQEKTIAYAIEKCREEGRFDNFLIAGGQMQGKTRGEMPFDDSDVYKVIEGASNSLISAPNPTLEHLLDSLIGIVKTGQEKDGYLTTWRTINPAEPPAPWVEVKEGKRWESLAASHELYNAGHMYEAAAVHYLATGKKNFLNIALKNADLMVQTFGDGAGQIPTVPGHQIIETGLIQLYKITGKTAYLDLAKYFLDSRGNPEHHALFGAYSQDHLPVTQQKEVVGHAVRAVYMYAAMTDIAAIKKDTAYRSAVEHLWENMVQKKMYITGGIGVKHEGESFGENYELPNLTAYSETCAAIGDVYWNHRLHALTGNVAYLDVIERTLYNGLISGLSLDGTHFFYPNALESDGVYKFNLGACTRQSWFDCSCCPTNVVRFIPAIPGLLYSKTDRSVHVNLYASNTATVALEDNTINVVQQTAYPWDGTVELTVTSEKDSAFDMKLRVPGWARNEVLPGALYHYVQPTSENISLSVDGQSLPLKIEDGYLNLPGQSIAGKTVTIQFPMTVRSVATNPLVEENVGKRALEYGPLVYAIEEIDNPQNFDSLHVSDEMAFETQHEPDLLGGVVTLKNKQLKAIPYYAWSNRGIGKMKVWIPSHP